MSGMTGADRSYHWGGGVPPFTEREINLEFEAGALQAKAFVDISKPDETIDSNILKGMPFGRNPSEASKPTLEFPIMNMRSSMREKGETDEALQKIMDRLTNLLPKEMQERLAQEMKLSEMDRNPAYKALENSFTYTAAALVLLYQASESFDGNAAALRHAEQNRAFNEQALINLLYQGRELLKEGYANLKKMGVNYPHFDTLLNHLKNTASAFAFLRQISQEEKKQKQHQDNEEDEEKEENKDKYSTELALKRLRLYATHYNEAFKGDQLQFMGPLLQAVNVIGKTGAINNGLSSLLFGLFFYQIGSEGKSAATLPLGQGFSQVIDQLLSVTNLVCLSKADPRAQELFPHLSKAFIMLCVIGAAFLITKHARHGDSEEFIIENDEKYLSKNEETLINTYTLWNLIVMFEKMDLLRTAVPDDLLDPEYGVIDSIDIIAETIELTTISIIIRAIKQSDEDASNLLLEGLAEPLILKIKTIEGVFDRITEKHLDVLGWDEKMKRTIAVQLINCRIDLQKEQFSRWHEHWDQVTIALGMEMKDIEKEINRLFQHADLLHTLFSEDLEDFSSAVTGIVQI